MKFVSHVKFSNSSNMIVCNFGTGIGNAKENEYVDSFREYPCSRKSTLAHQATLSDVLSLLLVCSGQF